MHMEKMAEGKMNVLVSYSFVTFLVVAFTPATKQQENALNVPQILLPYVPGSSSPTNYTLKAVRGCFHW